MQKTSNYQLCQWDPEDRILREDFNSDNAKLDAALAAVDTKIAAEAAAREALAGTVGTVRFHTVETTAAANVVDVRLPGISWSRWRMVYVLIYASGAGATSMTLYANDSSSSDNAMGGAQYFPAALLLFPLGSGKLRVSGICFGQTHPSPFLIRGETFSSLTGIRLVCNSSDVINAGRKLELWGVK